MGEVTTASDSLKTTCTSKKKKNDAIQLINTILQIKQQERVHRMQEVWLVRTSWVVAQGYMLYQQVRCPKFTYLVPLPSLLFWYGSSQLMRRHHFLDIIDGNQMNYLVEETGLLKTQDEEIATDVVQPNILNYIKGEEQDKKFYPKKILDYKLHTSPKDNTSWFNFSRKYWDYGHPIALENYSSTVSWSWIMLVGGVFAPLTIAGRAVPKDKLASITHKFGIQRTKRLFDAYYTKFVKPASGAVFWHFWFSFTLLGYWASRTKYQAQHPSKYSHH